MTLHNTSVNTAFLSRAFVMAAIWAGLWINLSEVVRYFLLVRPMMQEAFPMVADIAPINVPIFLSWIVWDTVLVFAASFIVWLFLERFGDSTRHAVLAGTFVWAAIFVILWLGLLNLGLANQQLLMVALPLAWLELVIAAIIIKLCRERYLNRA